MASAAMPPARYHILTYQYVPDIVEKRGPYREAHIAAAKSKLDAGILVMAGAAGDPVDSGMFIFKDVTKEQVEEYVQSDDYVKNGLVSSWSIKPYHVVVGNP
eukprot:jgi/Chrzof1/1963/Cz10g28040.t1